MPLESGLIAPDRGLERIEPTPDAACDGAAGDGGGDGDGDLQW